MSNWVKRAVDEQGNIFYYNDKGEFHRTDGPAVEHNNGDKFWYIDDKFHRLDGPAVVYGHEAYWYIHDNDLTEEDFNKHPLVLGYKISKLIDEILSED